MAAVKFMGATVYAAAVSSTLNVQQSLNCYSDGRRLDLVAAPLLVQLPVLARQLADAESRTAFQTRFAALKLAAVREAVGALNENDVRSPDGQADGFVGGVSGFERVD